MSITVKAREQIDPTSAERALSEWFSHGGCIRVPNTDLRTAKSKAKRRKYKKGYEIRFVARTPADLDRLRMLLAEAGMKAAKPYRKGRQIVQPVYGKKLLERFQSFSR
jgi:hypothetical protein